MDDILDRLLQRFPRMVWCITNAVLCIPVDEKKSITDIVTREPSLQEVQACGERLKEFVSICQPNLIVAMGKVAEKATRGLEIGPKVLFSRHPSWMQRDGQDTELEIKRMVFLVSAAYRKIQGGV